MGLASLPFANDIPIWRRVGYLKRALKSAGGVLQSRAMQVRPANRKDLPQILEIYNEAVLNTTASYDYEPRTLEHRTAWYEERVKANFPIFVAEGGKGEGGGGGALNPFHSRVGYPVTRANSVCVGSEQPC